MCNEHHPMLGYCWSSIIDDGPTLTQPWHDWLNGLASDILHLLPLEKNEPYLRQQ